MQRIYALLALSPLVVTLQGQAAECDQVVTDTVAEMQAGAAGWWSEDVANLVRAAAGSACVKALSGRYGVPEQAGAPAVDRGPAAAASAAETADRGDAVAAGSEDEAAQPGEQAADGDGNEEEFSFGGLTFRSLSGSPSKKPYERTRDKAEKDDEGR